MGDIFKGISGSVDPRTGKLSPFAIFSKQTRDDFSTIRDLRSGQLEGLRETIKQSKTGRLQAADTATQKAAAKKIGTKAGEEKAATLKKQGRGGLFAIQEAATADLEARREFGIGPGQISRLEKVNATLGPGAALLTPQDRSAALLARVKGEDEVGFVRRETTIRKEAEIELAEARTDLEKGTLDYEAALQKTMDIRRQRIAVDEISKEGDKQTAVARVQSKLQRGTDRRKAKQTRRLSEAKAVNEVKKLLIDGSLKVDLENLKTSNQKDLEDYKKAIDIELAKVDFKLKTAGDRTKSRLSERRINLTHNLAVVRDETQARTEFSFDKKSSRLEEKIREARAEKDANRAAKFERQKHRNDLDLEEQKQSGRLKLKEVATIPKVTTTDRRAIRSRVQENFALLFGEGRVRVNDDGTIDPQESFATTLADVPIINKATSVSENLMRQGVGQALATEAGIAVALFEKGIATDTPRFRFPRPEQAPSYGWVNSSADKKKEKNRIITQEEGFIAAVDDTVRRNALLRSDPRTAQFGLPMESQREAQVFVDEILAGMREAGYDVRLTPEGLVSNSLSQDGLDKIMKIIASAYGE